jgi:hypothetical protein
MRSSTILLLGGLIPAALSAWSNGVEASGVPRATRSEFVLYALSRGKGVPEAARDALEKSQTLLEDARQRGEVVKLTQTRLGLEGETKLCVQAKDAPASRKLQGEVRRIGKNVDLFNVVEESCSRKRP